MLRSVCAFVILCLLAACNTAGPGFRDAPEVTRSVDGSTFLIRVRDNMAEIIRTNPEFLPRAETIFDRAGRAVQDATGCDAAWVSGDPAMMLAGLSCDGAPPPPKPRRRSSVICNVTEYEVFGGASARALGLECDAL